MPGARISVSLAFAGCLTTALFWFLWMLIASRPQSAQVAAITHIDFSRLKADSEIEERKRVKAEIHKPVPPPDTPTVSASKSLSVGAGMDKSALAPSEIDFAGGSGDGPAGAFGSALAFNAGGDRDAMPQFRIDPDYPPGARERRIEGWVVVQFDVGTEGGTRNVRVVSAQPKGIFDREAIRAVAGWKYSPMIKDGRPAERRGIAVRLTFRLDK
ncbi:MAG TPA: energy transducer TonB [Myxococcota bacterium]|nr:energy transducer TonB [Myxococcota bacterium]